MSLHKVSMENLVTFLLTALCFLFQTRNCQDYDSCGLRSVHRGKILGGLQSRPGMWPWQVSLFRRRSDAQGEKAQFFCGGALINSRWILSAAHCFYKRPNEQYIHYRYIIKAGDHKISSKDPHEQERNAFRIYNHPNFIPSTYENDIALIELNKGVKMGPNVRPICLPKANNSISTPGEIVRVAGWGFTTKGSHSSVLLYSAFEIQSNKKCKDTTKYVFNEKVMFCAGHGKGGNDTCKGDSGGSTVREVLRDGRRRWVTVGLVSWGEGCGRKGKYGYYTRVKPFVNWIQKKINGSILSCGDPDNIPNGRINGSDFLVGFTVKYTCNEGYQLRGRSRSRCKRNGKWTKAPSCKKVECRDPGNPRYGVRRPRRKKYHYKEKIRFRCKTNHTIIGVSEMLCRSDGRWSGFKPACLAPCKDPGIPEGGVRLDHSFKHSQTVRFLCRKRNQPTSVSYLTCTNGRWNQNIPRCVADCDDPGIPTNGQRRGNDFHLKNKVYFNCDQGYMRVGPEYLQCQSNRRWSDKAPICEPLSCTRPTPPDNAYIFSRGQLKKKYGFNEVVMFHCNRGYRASGSPFVKCLNDGWSKTKLQCPPIKCDRLKDPEHGEKIEETSINFGGKVVFQCTRKGFELKGSRQRVCGEHGEWTGNNTTCERVACNIPETPNGKRDPEKNKYVFEDRVKFSCDTNYTLIGKSDMFCQYNKTWSREVPRCIEGCSRRKSPDSGDIYRNTWKNFYNHKDRVRFYCYRYYKLVGDEYSTCRDGVWTTDPPKCKRICGNPGRPANGGYRGSEFFEGREITFYCLYGLDLNGSQSTRCLSTGRWSARRPECKRRCNYPRIPYNAATSSPRLTRGQQYKHDTTISFSCRDRYTLDGQQTIRCNDGRWSSSIPVCKAPCSHPGSLQYGQMYGSNFLHGNQVIYTCSGLYMLEGASRLTCTDGRWDRTKPSCKAPCSDPGSPAKGYKRDADYRHGKSVSYTCQRGTRLVGRSSLTCNNGKWSSPLPSCLEICPVLRTPKNGYIHGRKSEYLSGERATFQCNSWPRRYDLFGNKEIICTKGVWSGEIPFCLGHCQVPSNLDYGVISSPRVSSRQWIKHGTKVSFSCRDNKTLLDGGRQITCNDRTWSSLHFPTCKVPCSDPGPIRNGTRRSTNFTVEYKCFQGYTLVGSSQRNCVGGRWTSSSPQCFENCRDPGSPTNGVKTGTDYRHGQGVFYRCTGRTRLRGNSRLTCKDGQWSSAVPKCLEKCPSPQRLTNGRYLINENRKWEYLSGDKVVYECSSGYDLVGNRELHCDRGRWNGSAPICAVPCSDPGPIRNGKRRSTNFTVEYKCFQGYTLIGSSRRKCVGGRWSSNAPQCFGRCLDPGVPRHGRRRGDSFTHQQTVEFFCNPGYELFGDSFIRCNVGRWSNPTPTCEAGCTDPGVPAGTRRKGFSFRSRSSLTYSCISHFKSISGNDVITCKDGNWSDSVPTCSDCGSPLGMESGKISDGSIQASSTRWKYHAKHGRLNGRYAWCSGTARDPYLQIDFGKPYRVTALATQGSAYDNKWVEQYTVTSNLAGSSFNMYTENNRDKIFNGNRDTGSVVKNKFRNPFIARRLRIYPQKKGGFSSFSAACMRVEIYGCDLPSDCVMVGSRVLAKWDSYIVGATKYYLFYKGYLTSISRRYWKVELENNHSRSTAQKHFLKYDDLPFVLDVPPKHDELQVGTRVLVPWAYRYYSGTIKTGRDRYNRYGVRADDGDEKDFTIDQIRLLKAPTFCN